MLIIQKENTNMTLWNISGYIKFGKGNVKVGTNHSLNIVKGNLITYSKRLQVFLFIDISVCVPGMFDSGGTCTNCSIGSRKSVPGDEENLCLDCPTDSITDGPGKTMDTDCGMCGDFLKT